MRSDVQGADDELNEDVKCRNVTYRCSYVVSKTRRYVLYVFYNLLEKRINTRILFLVKNKIRYIRYTS